METAILLLRFAILLPLLGFIILQVPYWRSNGLQGSIRRLNILWVLAMVIFLLNTIFFRASVKRGGDIFASPYEEISLGVHLFLFSVTYYGFFLFWKIRNKLKE